MKKAGVHPYVKAIKTLLRKHADAQQAVAMRRYMRDQFEYLGIKGSELGVLLKQHYTLRGLPDPDELEPILRDLWSLPQREFQYVGASLLGRFKQQLPAEFIEILEYLLLTKSWWDTVDTIAIGVEGIHFKRYPKVRRQYLAKWRKSNNFWLRRAAILFQLGYKKDTDFALLSDIIRENLGSQEFFINKAIGWALRQYTRVDPQAVRTFVAQTPLHPLSAREALKWLEKKKR